MTCVSCIYIYMYNSMDFGVLSSKDAVPTSIRAL